VTPSPEVDILPDEIHVRWSDGSVSKFTHLELRMMCPCALCKTGASEALGPPPVDAHVKALDFAPVGRYALQFYWSDGHNTGIYPLTDLRGA